MISIYVLWVELPRSSRRKCDRGQPFNVVLRTAKSIHSAPEIAAAAVCFNIGLQTVEAENRKDCVAVLAAALAQKLDLIFVVVALTLDRIAAALNQVGATFGLITDHIPQRLKLAHTQRLRLKLAPLHKMILECLLTHEAGAASAKHNQHYAPPLLDANDLEAIAHHAANSSDRIDKIKSCDHEKRTKLN